MKNDCSLIYNCLFKHLKIKQNKEISIVFIDNKFSQEINAKYRKKDYPTDVISFEFNNVKNQTNDIEQILGEIFINIEKANQQAIEYGHSKKREYCFLFLHGLLHILGYDHQKQEDRKVMFALQKLILNKCNIKR